MKNKNHKAKKKTTSQLKLVKYKKNPIIWGNQENHWETHQTF